MFWSKNVIDYWNNHLWIWLTSFLEFCKLTKFCEFGRTSKLSLWSLFIVITSVLILWCSSEVHRYFKKKIDKSTRHVNADRLLKIWKPSKQKRCSASTTPTRQGDPVNTIFIPRLIIILQDISARKTWILFITDWKEIAAAAATFPVTVSVCEAQNAGQGNTQYAQIFHVKTGSTMNKKSRGEWGYV